MQGPFLVQPGCSHAVTALLSLFQLLSSANCSPEESGGNGVCFAKITAVILAGSK